MVGRVCRQKVSCNLCGAAFVTVLWGKGRRVRIFLTISVPDFVVNGERLEVLGESVFAKVMRREGSQGVEFSQIGLRNTELVKGDESKGRDVITTGCDEEECACASNG